MGAPPCEREQLTLPRPCLKCWRKLLITSLRFLRINTFYRLMLPFSAWARKRRMQWCASLLRLDGNTSIIDLGGQPMIWNDIPQQLNITILNLEGVARTEAKSHHRIQYVAGDACNVSSFGDKQFDVVFSNS